jgi:hypothetical protein
MNSFTKLLPSLLALASALSVALAPTIQHYLAGHPVATSLIAGVVGIVLHWLPSPASPTGGS